jgi:hypothetical protein
MPPPTSCWRPSHDSFFDLRVGRLKPRILDEPAVTGLLTLYVSLWQLMSLPFLSPVFANALSSQYVVFSLPPLVYQFQRQKRTNLGLSLGYGVAGFVVLPNLVRLNKAVFSRLSFSIEP